MITRPTEHKENKNMANTTDRIEVDFSIIGTYHAHKNGEIILFDWDKSQMYIVFG